MFLSKSHLQDVAITMFFFFPKYLALRVLNTQLVQREWLTLSSNRGITEFNFYFLHSLLPQDSINHNNAQLKQGRGRQPKKLPQTGCLGVVHFLQVQVPKQATLNH